MYSNVYPVDTPLKKRQNQRKACKKISGVHF